MGVGHDAMAVGHEAVPVAQGTIVCVCVCVGGEHAMTVGSL